MPVLQTEFEELLLPVLDRAYAVAWRLTSSRDDAEDLVQEASLKAWAAFHSFARGTHFRAWFLRILVNGFLNRQRQAQRRPQTVPLDEGDDLFLYSHARRQGLMGVGRDPAAVLMSKVDSATVAEAVARLPEEFRVVATLFLVEDLSYEEIANIVGCPIGTVRSRLHRARQQLQKSLWDLAVERGLVKGGTS